ncbi:RNAseH domain-containing protein [Nocardia terpenica]|uniref:pPIWI_RE module domain-containing protein n=1 Tax=Nocardia terpenica TaxID=455432 RepID=UPI002FDF35D4
MSNDFLRQTAYHLRPNYPDWSPEFHVIRFEDDWIAELKALRTRLRKRDDGQNNLPVKALNQLFEAISPSVIAARNAEQSEDGVWLYARREVPVEIIWAGINNWVRGWRSWKSDDEGEDDIAQVLQQLRTTPLRWYSSRVDLTEQTIMAGGAGIPHQRIYRLVPEVLAASLVACPYEYGGSEIPMRILGGGTRTELVSWPPQQYRSKGRVWHYSLRVRISVQTVPFHPDFRVHVTSGIRRWMTGRPLQLNRQGATAVIETDLEWLGQSDEPSRLITGSLRYNRNAGQYQWGRNSLPVVLPDFSAACPPADQLIQDPNRWASSDLQAFVVYHTGHEFDHKVEHGLLPKERRLIDEWVHSSLRKWLVRGAELAPALGSRPLSRPRPRPIEDQVAARGRRSAVARAIGGRPLRIELLYQESAMLELVIERLCMLLDLTVPQAPLDELQWHTPQLTVILTVRQTGAELAPLKINGHTRDQRLISQALAVQERRAAVATSFPALGPEEEVPVALIELMGAKKFARLADPKLAIRLGCAKAGRVSQFIRPISESKKDASHRVTFALIDGFRQLGAIPVPDHTLGDLLTTDLDYIGLWMLRKRRGRGRSSSAEALVAVRIRRTEDGYAIEGWSTLNRGWCPYPRLLLELAELAEIPGDPMTPSPLSKWHTHEDKQRACAAEIRTILHRVRDRPTLLIVDAHNLRLAWPWLQNGQLMADHLRFDDLPPQRIDLFGSHLRLAVVRGTPDETPQWYRPKDSDEGVTAGFKQGLWEPAEATIDNRVFVSTAEVPAYGGRDRSLIKIVPEARKPHSPEVAGWNPRYLEITVAGCLSPEILAVTERDDTEPDVPRALAALVHQLRVPDDYSGPLRMPLPNHLAELAGEYVLPSLADEGDPGDEGDEIPCVEDEMDVSDIGENSFEDEAMVS